MAVTSKELLTAFFIKNGRLSKEQYAGLKVDAAKASASIDEFIESRSVFPEEDIAQAKSEIYKLPYIDLFSYTVTPEFFSIVPREVAQANQAVAFRKEGDTVDIAIVDPSDSHIYEVVDFIVKPQNLKSRFFVTTPAALKNVLGHSAPITHDVEAALKEQSEAQFKAKNVAELDSTMEQLTGEAPIAKLVYSFIKYAIDNKASDIHIEPLSDKTRVRHRIDGVLRNTAFIPFHLHEPVISRIKVLSNLKLDEKRIPQDGRIRITIEDREIDIRVSTLPLLTHEKVVMRILDPKGQPTTLEELGFWGKILENIMRGIAKPHGMVLVTGPTGCGKTTTLYAVLRQLNKIGVNIVTLEDPIEYYMEGTNQSQVKPDIGYSFASGIRSIVRQDPNIIMVGEIRDNETAELAIHAALTGHLVFSTLHTNDALGAIPRLVDMKAEPFLIAASINVVIAQRLVRKICDGCKEEIQLPDHVRVRIEKAFEKNEFFKADEYMK
ncbi:MAG: type II/IV secretion system protein, partial [Parcubacteria group bacterium]|nr:type II/IV secretion system protein [Parcubacteria group bacterium]